MHMEASVVPQITGKISRVALNVDHLTLLRMKGGSPS